MFPISRVIPKVPPLGRIRLACVEDAPIAMQFLNEPIAKTFRIDTASDIVYLIENGVLSITQLDDDDRIVGFMALKDYPMIPSIHPSAWEEYIWTKYKAVNLNSRNTLFIHLMCWNTSYQRTVVDSMLKSVFMHDPHVHFIAFVKTLRQYPLLIPGQSRTEASFRRVLIHEKGISGEQLPTLCIADRTEVSPRLRIRRAVEEDNDDLIPILERHAPQLREMYGDFYISELISRHPESERVLLVAEHKEVAVGVMCLNTQVNFEALEESFELSPFAGLRKMNVSPFYGTKLQMDSTTSYSASTNNVMGEVVVQVSPSDNGPVGGRENAKSRVTWLFDQEDFKDLGGQHTPTSQSSTPVAQLDILHLLEDDEDEFEFDIVNIDTDLLRVPKYLTYDDYECGGTESIIRMLESKRLLGEEKSKKEKPKRFETAAMISPLTKEPEPVRYTGPSNAFVLEMFAMNQDYDERYGFDMLEVAYELFPGRDYCILCLPSNHASFPLLEHFTLVTPYSLRPKFINETLYVAHINSIRGDLKVRPGTERDLEGLYDILEHAPRVSSLFELFESSIYSNTMQCFVLLSQNQPIGTVILGPLEEAVAVRTQYDLEPEPRRPGTDGFVSFSIHSISRRAGGKNRQEFSNGPLIRFSIEDVHESALTGKIISGVMSPVLEPHSRWYLRELLRLSRYSTLFWLCRLFGRGDSNPSRNLMSLASHMTPVHPRLSLPNLSGNKDLDRINKDVSTPFALWVLERPLTSLPKVYVNNSIVVVGASRTGLAFLESLILGPTSQYLTFSNVTLVSEHGLPTVSECLRAAITCVAKDGRYTDRYLKSIPFFFYIDIMSAVMVGIDRKKKCIYLKGGGVKYYDELVLTCGQQFQHPDYLREPLELVKEVERGKPCDRLLMDDLNYHPDRVPLPPEMPDNVMVINSLYQANLYLRKLLRTISDAKDQSYSLSAENPVAVYGECIEAYSCVAALLELGLAPHMITFIEPFPSVDPTKMRVNCFNNETVDERVQRRIEKLGIRVFRKHHLASWMQRGSHVESLHLMSQLQATVVPIFALFYYGLKAIDINAFKAINDCGLVYDGGLVVGTAFETNDPHVFGAGTCVKYSRRLYADRKAHKYYCSEDVGEALAQMFLVKLDPFLIADPTTKVSDLLPRYNSSILGWQPVMRFDSPIVNSATLPGPLYYMKVRKPGPEIPMEVQFILPHQGHTLITDKKSRYFRLQLNNLHCVEAVTCLSDKAFSDEIFTQLYGKHEAFFNKLLNRYMMGGVDDLFAFFTQPWMAAMYQETFADLLNDINEQEVGTIFDIVRSRCSMFNENVPSRSVSISIPPSAKSSQLDVPNVGYGPKEAKNLGTFRSVIDRFIARKSSLQVLKSARTSDMQPICGQTATLRAEAAGFWKTVHGETIVNEHLAQYLAKNSVTNQQYATPMPKQE